MKMSKGFFLGSILGGLGGGVVLGILGAIFGASSRMDEAAIPLIALAVVAFLYAAIVVMVMIYKMWAAIQDGHARATPGKALGFCFIPLFNYYWIFQVYWGWSKDYNAYIRRHNINTAAMPEGLFLTVPILILCSIVPFVGMLAGLVNLILMIILVGKICDGVNAIAGKATAAPAPAAG